EIAEVIRHACGFLPWLNEREPSGLPSFAKCCQRIVLTGSVGQGFGCVENEEYSEALSGDPSPSTLGNNGREFEHKQDLLCATIVRCLRGTRGGNPSIEVVRSRIAVASIRETEGFQYYLTN